MRKNACIAISLAVTLSVLGVSHIVHASASSPSPTPLASATSSTSSATADINQVTDSIKARLQQTLNSATSDDTTATARAYIGTVSDIIQNTIVMQDKDGKRNIVTNADTTITRSPGSAHIKVTDVQIGDAIIAMGFPTSTEEMNAKNIIVSATPITAPAKTTGFGTIAKLTKTTMVVTSATGDSTTVTLSGNTDVKSTTDTLTLNDLSEGDTIVYTADLDGNQNQTATVIMQIQAAPTPTPSVKPSPSPKATKAKASPSPSPAY